MWMLVAAPRHVKDYTRGTEGRPHHMDRGGGSSLGRQLQQLVTFVSTEYNISQESWAMMLDCLMEGMKINVRVCSWTNSIKMMVSLHFSARASCGVSPRVPRRAVWLRTAAGGLGLQHKTQGYTAQHRGEVTSPHHRRVALSPRLAPHRLSSSAHCEDAGPGTVSVLMVS